MKERTIYISLVHFFRNCESYYYVPFYFFNKYFFFANFFFLQLIRLKNDTIGKQPEVSNIRILNNY